jgi:hypothetical protein
MKTLVAGLVGVLVLTGCAPVEDVDSAQRSETQPAASPEQQTAPSHAAAPAAVRSKAPPPPAEASTPEPWLYLLCPAPGAAPAFVEFGWDGNWTGEATVEMDYGDGDIYTAIGDADIEANAFEHSYDRAGDFFVTATLTDGEGRTVMADCSLSLSERTVYAAPPPAGYGYSYGGFDEDTCTYNGIPLHGDVRVVQYGGDMAVRRVQYGGDLVVREMTYGGSRCGEWRFVRYGGDFSVRFVDYGGDFTVRFARY